MEYTEEVVTYFLLTEYIGIRRNIFPKYYQKKEDEK